jgi:hypothetical protein
MLATCAIRPKAEAGDGEDLVEVTTFQNSAMFCSVKSSGSPVVRNRATLSTATA